jgi:hypothetical protein
VSLMWETLTWTRETWEVAAGVCVVGTLLYTGVVHCLIIVS